MKPTTKARLQKELSMLSNNPPTGIAVWPSKESLTAWHATISGPPDTPYSEGEFHLTIAFPERYPFEPPSVQFKTSVYHPNVDDQGRICLDALKMPPTGAWKPSINVSSLLASIRLLLAHPNAEDGLMAQITEQYINDRPAFIAAARAATRKYATAASSSDAKPTKGEEETEDPTSSERASEAEASCKHDGSEEQAAKRQKIDPSTQ